VIIASFLFIVLLVTWTTLAFQQSATELNASERFIDTGQAFNLAEAGLNDAVQWMRAQAAPPAGTVAFNPFGAPQSLGPGTYTVAIDPDDANPTSAFDHFTVTSVGRDATTGVVRQLVSVLRIESASRYSYLTNSEERRIGDHVLPLWFTSHDRAYGPVHTNGRWHIAGSPQFHGPTSSVATTVDYQNGGPPRDNPQFHQGVTLGAPPVTLPRDTSHLRLAAASASGAWFIGNTTIVLKSDGTMVVTNAALGWTNRVRPPPPNGALFVNGGHATVSGTLKGQLTIGSSEHIIVVDHVDYATNPLTRGGSDLLGLVAEKDVVISASAPSGLRVSASLIAPNGSFTLERWWIPPPKGELHILGGILQDVRGAVGTFDPRQNRLVSGYAKDYKYDERLQRMSPPFFPGSAQYEEVLWQELQNN
jgi:hypothetical protein